MKVLVGGEWVEASKELKDTVRGIKRGLDRPKLREILENAVEWDGRKIIPDNVDEVYSRILSLLLPKEVYCLGENTGCDHEDNPTEECSDCPYMTTIKPKPQVLSDEEIKELCIKHQLVFETARATAQAQWDIWNKWYEGG